MYIVFMFVWQGVGQFVDSLRYEPKIRVFFCLPLSYWDLSFT